MTELFEVEERDDHRIAAGAHGPARDVQPGGAADRGRRARRVPDLRRWPARRADEVALAVAVDGPRRAARLGLRRPRRAGRPATAPRSCPGPTRTTGRPPIAASPLDDGRRAPARGRAALPRPVLARGGSGPRRPARPGSPRRRPSVDEAALAATADRLFPEGYDEQRAAALAAARQWTTVLTGGPGTGKTTTVAGLLALLTEQAERLGSPLRIALTAPTGKASARLQQAVEEAQAEDRFSDADRARLSGLTASTLHRLLGWTPGSRNRFRHHRRNKLPHDVVVVDETSMVSLTMMARLLEAVRPDARLDARGRRRPARQRRGRSGARRPGAGARRPRARRGDRAAHHPPVRREHRRARRVAAPGRCRPGPRRC